MCLAYGESMPYALLRWRLVKETGWTLEYIDSLSMADIHEREQVMDGEAKAYQQKGGRK